MTVDREQVRRDAERLRAEGLSWRAVGRRLGIDARRVQRVLEPETGRRYSETARRWRERNPEKAGRHKRVWWTVQSAIRNGSLARPDRCEECAAECVPHGHHDDYGKPLDVRWLCARCHAAVHKQVAA